MSKKSKRQVSRQIPRPLVPVAAKTTEFNPDYSITKSANCAKSASWQVHLSLS